MFQDVGDKRDSINKEVTLTLDNGNTVTFSVVDIVNGLVNETDFQTAVNNLQQDVVAAIAESKEYTDNQLSILGDIDFESTGMVITNIIRNSNNANDIWEKEDK